MPKINLYLVRHGRAAAGFDSHADPDLDDLGREQATTVAQQLAASLSPIAVITSPIARARQTAGPLAELWNRPPAVVPAISEIPSPTTDLAARAAWLRDAMQGPWTDLPEPQQLFRHELVAYLRSATEDQVLFSHFVAINLAVGAATNDERMVVFRPDNASVTHLTNEDGVLKVVSLGGEADTRVN